MSPPDKRETPPQRHRRERNADRQDRRSGTRARNTAGRKVRLSRLKPNLIP